LLAAASPWLGARVASWQLQRWRYSIPIKNHLERSLVVSQPAPIAFAGDAFGGARVEGAALSGIDAAEHLIALLAM
jgi:predicted NAD/FAD-dependent oxidoreductase